MRLLPFLHDVVYNMCVIGHFGCTTCFLRLMDGEVNVNLNLTMCIETNTSEISKAVIFITAFIYSKPVINVKLSHYLFPKLLKKVFS